MSQKKSTHTKSYQGEGLLDNILWFIENCLPQKNKRTSHAKQYKDKFELFTFKKIKKLASDHAKLLRKDPTNTTLTFTVGSWALPYLNFLKRIKLLK